MSVYELHIHVSRVGRDAYLWMLRVMSDSCLLLRVTGIVVDVHVYRCRCTRRSWMVVTRLLVHVSCIGISILVDVRCVIVVCLYVSRLSE